jgi:hypothetical protein
MSSAPPPPIQAFSHEVQSAPIPVGGWLLSICISLTILIPGRAFREISTISSPAFIVIYGMLGLTNLLAGLLTWVRSSSAFIFLRVALATRFLYGLFQLYLAILAEKRGPSHAAFVQQEFVGAAINIFMTILIFMYFRVSSRVAETFGRNI